MTMRIRQRLLVGLVGGLWAFATHAQALQESFDLGVPVPPTPVVIEAQTRLFYELHLSNFARRPLDPVRVEVRDATTGATLAVFEGEALERQLDRSGLQWKAEAGAPIAPGRRGILFFELAMPAGMPTPVALTHRVAYHAQEGEGILDVDGPAVPVARTSAVTLGPPLRGGPWIAIYDPVWERGHRRVVYALDGQARTPGRFAIDWVKLDAQGRKSGRDSGRVADAYSHGEAVLAVADGIVARVRNDLPERERLDERSDHALETGGGNSVVLDLGDGRFAHYGHLRTGSVRVVPGQRVHRGETIAEVGFTGSASDPQLHFNLSDGASTLGSEGLPFALDRFHSLGAYARIDDVGRAPWTPRREDEDTRRNELPAGNSVVVFEE